MSENTETMVALAAYPNAWITQPDGTKVLNPAIASLLLERLQFDGDIAGGRDPHTPFAPGVLPAVNLPESEVLALDTLAQTFRNAGLRLLGDTLSLGDLPAAQNPLTTTHGRDALSHALSRWVIRRLWEKDNLTLSMGRGHAIFDRVWRFDMHHPEHITSQNTLVVNAGLALYLHARKFLLSGDVGNGLLLSVSGVHDIPGRVVGWRIWISEPVQR